MRSIGVENRFSGLLIRYDKALARSIGKGLAAIKLLYEA